MTAPTLAADPADAPPDPHAPFLRCILDQQYWHPPLVYPWTGPDDTRLIYADWLEESGECARAELIRVGCELAKIMRAPSSARNVLDEKTLRPLWCGHEDACPRRVWEDLCHVHKLRTRERELGEKYAAEWVAQMLGWDIK